nr:unnamed protein product [Callosobruchus analis]
MQNESTKLLKFDHTRTVLQLGSALFQIRTQTSVDLHQRSKFFIKYVTECYLKPKTGPYWFSESTSSIQMVGKDDYQNK